MKENKKITRIYIKVSNLEKEEVIRKSNVLGMNISAYVRSVILNHRIIIKTDKDMIRQIKYIGNNINQIAHQLNMYSDGLIIADAYKQMEEYKLLLESMLDTLTKK